MSSRRIPLASNPNAANSPFRVPAVTKRSRAQADHKDSENVYSPPKKRQLLGIEPNGTRRAQHISPDEREGKVFLGRTDSASANAFNRKLAAAGRQSQQRIEQQKAAEREVREGRITVADQETIRQWRKHYRKAFPSFVFYFESLPADVALKASKNVASLGAREEKFFSRAVTHIVTTRTIPPSSEQDAHGRTNQSSQRTINPSLLERSTDALASVLQRGSRQPSESIVPRARQGGNADILHKAKELGIKMWALEKFERMMNTMFETDVDEELEHARRRERAAEQNLAQLLRYEKERKTATAAAVPLYSDIQPFRGYYIYIHDMDEKVKPVMVREYKASPNKLDGDWPQFRSVPLPRCPFVDDPQAVRREAREEERRQRLKEYEEELVKAQRQQPRTRAAAATIEAARGRPTTDVAHLTQTHDAKAAKITKHAPTSVPLKTFDPPAVRRANTNTSLDSMPPHMTSARLNVHARPGHEPMASGLQQNNVTSAIRSQMISSTAAAPTVRAGTAKGLEQLQRRAVERRTNLSTTAVPTADDVRAAINNEPPPRTRHAGKKSELARIHEDDGDERERGTTAPKEKAVVQKDPKPGYCENCRDKYEDFTEHIESRKHRKFALTTENWTELDDLLQKLVRH